MERAHSKINKIVCEVCGKDLSKDLSEKSHYNSLSHSYEKHHKCSTCNSTNILRFGDARDEYEYNGSTSGLKTISFACSFSDCGKTFTSRNSLLLHGKVHAGGKPFSK